MKSKMFFLVVTAASLCYSCSIPPESPSTKDLQQISSDTIIKTVIYYKNYQKLEIESVKIDTLLLYNFKKKLINLCNANAPVFQGSIIRCKINPYPGVGESLSVKIIKKYKDPRSVIKKDTV